MSPWKNESFARLSLSNIDAKFLPGTKQEARFLARELEVDPGALLLDLGCGAGRHSIELARQGYNVTGVDISETLLREASSRAQQAGVQVSFHQADLRTLDETVGFNIEEFHGAYCICESGIGFLGGTANDLRCLRSVWRLLKPGSKLVLTCFNGLRRYLRSRDTNPKFDFTEGVLHWEAPMDDECLLREEQRLYIPSEMRLIMEFSGFTGIQVFGTSPGCFDKRELCIEDIEMMLVAEKEA